MYIYSGLESYVMLLWCWWKHWLVMNNNVLYLSGFFSSDQALFFKYLRNVKHIRIKYVLFVWNFNVAAITKPSPIKKKWYFGETAETSEDLGAAREWFTFAVFGHFPTSYMKINCMKNILKFWRKMFGTVKYRKNIFVYAVIHHHFLQEFFTHSYKR